MRDEIQNYLYSVCMTQIWVKNHLKKEIQVVEKINTMSISSIKQKFKKKPTNYIDEKSRWIKK